MSPGSVLYNDMEHYNRSDSSCRTAVLTFLSGWTTRLHERGYRSGVYSSASSGIADLVDTYNSTTYARPDHIWLARWDGVATTSDSTIPASYWSNHQRVKQYLGGHNETYGGVAINIDNNYLDVADGGRHNGVDTVGWYRPGDATFHLAAANVSGTTSFAAFEYGVPSMVPIAGDWNGDGVDPGTRAARHHRP
jgi:hypothetical protein